MNPFVVIEAIGAILYFAQKIALSSGKRIGWLLGLIGSIAFTIVTLHKASYAYSVLEITSGITFLFGLVLWKKDESAQRGITFVMSGIALLGILLVFSLNLGSPNWLLENSMVVAFSIGAVLLVLRKPAGWLLYLVGQVILIAYAYQLRTYFILALQVVSIPFMILGYRNLRNTIGK